MKTPKSCYSHPSLLPVVLMVIGLYIMCGGTANAVEVRHVNPGEYSQITRATIDKIFEEHGFTMAQRKGFVVIRLVPLELGGSNAKANLIIVSRDDERAHDALVRGLVLASKRGTMTYAQAAKQLAAWNCAK
jgi:hypothetical protein